MSKVNLGDPVLYGTRQGMQYFGLVKACWEDPQGNTRANILYIDPDLNPTQAVVPKIVKGVRYLCEGYDTAPYFHPIATATQWRGALKRTATSLMAEVDRVLVARMVEKEAAAWRSLLLDATASVVNHDATEADVEQLERRDAIRRLEDRTVDSVGEKGTDTTAFEEISEDGIFRLDHEDGYQLHLHLKDSAGTRVLIREMADGGGLMIDHFHIAPPQYGVDPSETSPSS